MYKVYKKYLFIVLVTVLVLVAGLIITGDLIIRNCKLSRIESDVYNTNQWYKKKRQIAESMSQKGNKIIFLSGSNTLFGVNTKEIEDTFGIPTLNFGVHAGYNHVNFIQVIDYMYKGDIVILPLEIVYYTSSTQKNYINDLIASYIISFDKNLYKSLNLANKFYCIRYLYFKYPTNKKEKNNIPISIGPYSINNWNANGDVISYRKPNENYVDTESYQLTDLDLISISDRDTYLNNFLQICKNREVKVYFMPPVLQEGKGNVATLQTLPKMWEHLGYPHILEVNDSIYAKNLMYDTPNHLSSKGAHIRTQQIIKAMEQAGFKRKK